MALTRPEEYGLALFLVLVFLVPVGVILLVSEEAPYQNLSGVPVEDAARAAGITVTSARDTTWNLPGATGGKTYVLSDRDGNTARISTQAFDSATSRDAAIRLNNAHTVGKGKTIGSLMVVGQYLVYTTPANSPILHQLAPELKKIRGS